LLSDFIPDFRFVKEVVVRLLKTLTVLFDCSTHI
jgi:hypothetical protein